MAKAPITNEILELVRGYARKSDMSLSEFGRIADVSKAWLSKLKNTDANLSLETATNLLNAIGYDLKVVKSGKSQIDQSETTTESKTASRLKRVKKCQNI